MIEVTDEMVAVFRRARNDAGCGYCDSCSKDVLAAVLAIVERDWNMQPNPNAPRWRCNRVTRCARQDGPHVFDGSA